jgi:hypothetical protein
MRLLVIATPSIPNDSVDELVENTQQLLEKHFGQDNIPEWRTNPDEFGGTLCIELPDERSYRRLWMYLPTLPTDVHNEIVRMAIAVCEPVAFPATLAERPPADTKPSLTCSVCMRIMDGVDVLYIWDQCRRVRMSMASLASQLTVYRSSVKIV